jgi:hypothetical protein
VQNRRCGFNSGTGVGNIKQKLTFFRIDCNELSVFLLLIIDNDDVGSKSSIIRRRYNSHAWQTKRTGIAMTELTKCTTCGGELLTSSGQTFCPACLLQQGMKSSTYAEDRNPHGSRRRWNNSRPRFHKWRLNSCSALVVWALFSESGRRNSIALLH